MTIGRLGLRILLRVLVVAALLCPAAVANSRAGNRHASRGRAAPCAVPRGWKVVVSNAQVVVILHQPTYPIQQYRYCNYARSGQGFRLFAWHDDSHYLGGYAIYTTVLGLARAYLLYQSTTYVDSPYCNGTGNPARSSQTYVLDTGLGITKTVPQGSGEITSALLSPTGLVASIVNGGKGLT